jgi:hypothetical protein
VDNLRYLPPFPAEAWIEATVALDNDRLKELTLSYLFDYGRKLLRDEELNARLSEEGKVVFGRTSVFDLITGIKPKIQALLTKVEAGQFWRNEFELLLVAWLAVLASLRKYEGSTTIPPDIMAKLQLIEQKTLDCLSEFTAGYLHVGCATALKMVEDMGAADPEMN